MSRICPHLLAVACFDRQVTRDGDGAMDGAWEDREGGGFEVVGLGLFVGPEGVGRVLVLHCERADATGY